MTEEQKAFLEACKPLMKYLAENHHPHKSAIVTACDAELISGEMTVGTEEFLKD